MANAGLKCVGCICACFVTTVNNFATLIGLLLFALGMLFTVGINYITGNESVKEALQDLSDQLNAQANQNIDINELVKSVSSITGTMGIVLIIVGVVVVTVSCIGCFGVCCKIRPCLIIYAVAIGILFLGQLIVVIIWYADSSVLKLSAKRAMEQSVAEYKGFTSTNIQSLLQNLLQIFVGCCGVNNGTDFHSINSNWDRRFIYNQGGRNVTFNLTYPASCCEFHLDTLQPKNTLCFYNNTDSNYNVGCYDKLFNEFIEKYFLDYVFPVLAGTLAFQLLIVGGTLLYYFAVAGDQNKVKPVLDDPPPRTRPSPPVQPRSLPAPQPSRRSIIPSQVDAARPPENRRSIITIDVDASSWRKY